MFCALRYNRLVWLGIGVVVGLLLGGIWPESPLHAVATDHSDTFAVATGPLDDNVEAVVMLDFLTGNLQGRVIGPQTATFQAYYEGNVMAGLATVMQRANAQIKDANRLRERKSLPPLNELQAPQKPNFLLVTGSIDLRRGAANARAGRTIIYVVETTTGIVLAYGMPWAPEILSQRRVYKGSFQLMAGECFRAEAGT